MNLEELNRLDLKSAADWPMGAKLGLLGVLFALVVAAGWWFLWSPALETLDAGKVREDELKSTYATKRARPSISMPTRSSSPTSSNPSAPC